MLHIFRSLWRLPGAISRFPWRNTARVLRSRFREDRLGVTAGSLTFTTIISLVPLVTVSLAIFSAFPQFAQLQNALEQWMSKSLFPPAIASSVMQYITTFASKAHQLGWLSSAVLLVTAIALMLTVDGALNGIWRVRRKRSLTQRILVYWGCLTLGPVVLALIFSSGSSAWRYALSFTPAPLLTGAQESAAWPYAAQFALMTFLMSALYRLVPNTTVRWTHAILGGVFVAVGIDLAQRGLTAYLRVMPNYEAIYGAFATVPILLLWVYILWVLVLLGAVIAAYLPSLLSGIGYRNDSASDRLQLSLDVLSALQRSGAQSHAPVGLSLQQLMQQLRAADLQIDGALERLQQLHWVGQLQEDEQEQSARFVLLRPLTQMPLEQLLQQLWAQGDTPAMKNLRRHLARTPATLADILLNPSLH